MNTQTQSWLIDRTQTMLTSDFNQAYASLIVNIAANSPASQLGLDAGDFLVTVDSEQAATVNLLEKLVEADDCISYQFYSCAKHSYINVVASNIPLGMVTESSSEGIVEQCRQEGFTGWDNLEILWQRRNWDMLLEVSDLVSSHGLMSRLTRFISQDFNRSAEALFKGAAMYELGNKEAAIDLIFWFIDKDIDNHELSLHAIAYYYAARWMELKGDKKESKRWLAKANKSNGNKFERITQEVSLKGYESPYTRYQSVGKFFPGNYNLDTIGKSGRVSLRETLNSMRADEILPICVMPAYRGNGPYNDAMLCYRAVYGYIANRVRPMQVILDETEKRADRSAWYEHEEAALEEGIPLTLLHDKECFVAEQLALEYSPAFYLLDHEGKIVYQGPLDQPFEYWQALSSQTR